MAPATLSERTYIPRSIHSPDAIVHLEYQYGSELPKPSAAWTRFVCLSDTHNKYCPVPNGDVLLHSGDLTGKGRVPEFKQTMDWLYSLPHKVKIVIAGNHDLTLHRGWYEQDWKRWHHVKQDYKEVIALLKGPAAREAGIVYLENEQYQFSVKEQGRQWSIYGSPWTPWFFDWAFNYERDKADEIVSKFPKTDILLTHGPPHNIFDETRSGDKAGCHTLAARLPQLQPRLHVFGHIHEGHGAYIHSWGTSQNSNSAPSIQATTNSNAVHVHNSYSESPKTVFVNAANMPSGPNAIRNDRMVTFGGPGYQPVVVDLKD
ncbi:hypothetical protein AMATHDRAFT_68646 [Amanita thiersii Skay4041]|uniref:Calcineurin-like phosphoesterase domain-containing protein n=1 Tax=Amanita thiersii Skay4041 TaxID=703135 RepID=A0A2A9NH28_9AGAR|nr:hypothetical protein AMATHDRAFT_68646 [Amanita thiersii Skay4041]